MVKISDAELKVMDVIWRRKEITSSEIIKELEDSNWSSNTIRTLVRRLEEKGAIEVVRINGKLHIYKPIIDYIEYRDEATRDLLSRLYNNSILEFITSCYEGGDIKVKDIKKIIEDIEEKEGKK